MICPVQVVLPRHCPRKRTELDAFISLLLLAFVALGAVVFRHQLHQRESHLHGQDQAQPATLTLQTAEIKARQFELAQSTAIGLGRDPNAWVYLEDGLVSAQHAFLFWDAAVQTWCIEDNASRNGTFVNTTRISLAHLRPNDVIRVGNTRLVYNPA